ncbi:hypothetical protein ACOL3I_00740 [Aliarcobacter butzleri]
MNFNNINLVLVGAKNSGKTYYLSKLSEKLISVNDETTQYINTIKKDIEKSGQTKATSSSWHELSFKYNHEKHGNINFTIDDYDGNLTETMSNNEEKESKERLKDSVGQSKGCIFFIPYEKTIERLNQFSDEIDSFIISAQFSKQNKSPIPACMVVTKWDDSDFFKKENEIEEAEKYLQDNKNLEVIYNKIKDYFQNYKIMVLSSTKSYKVYEPIDFCFEKTFEQWYKRAKEYKEESKWENLFEYLQYRWNDIEKCKSYDFKAIYENAEKEFIKILNEQIQKATSLKKKEEISNKYKEFNFNINKDENEILKQLEQDIKNEKSIIEDKKLKNKIITILTIVVCIAIYFIYNQNSEYEEKYKNIIMAYEKDRSYKDIKPLIDDFKSFDAFIIFNMQNKKDKIYQIEINLKNKESKKIEEIEQDNVINDTQKKVLLQQEIVHSETSIKKLEAAEKEKYKDKLRTDINDCLQISCIENNQSSLNKIENYIHQIDGEFQDDYELKSLKSKLYQRQEKIEKEIIRKGFVAEINNFLKFNLENNDETIEKIGNYDHQIESKFEDDRELKSLKSELSQKKEYVEKEIFKNEVDKFLKDSNFENRDETIEKIENYVHQIESKFENNYELKNLKSKLSQKRKHIINNWKTSVEECLKIDSNCDENEIDELKKQLFSINDDEINDIKNSLENKKKFLSLYNKIEEHERDKIDDVEKISNIEEQEFKNFQEDYKKKIYEILKVKYDNYFENNIVKDIPIDILDDGATLGWKQRYEKFKDSLETKLEYTYQIPEKDDIKKFEEDLKNLEAIKQNGLTNIEVAIRGKEGNTISFGCGINTSSFSVGRSKEEIIIEGFSSKLTYENASKCKNETILFKDNITLEKKDYTLNLTEVNLGPNFKLEEQTISFELKELWDLFKGNEVIKQIDNDKIELKFKRKKR